MSITRIISLAVIIALAIAVSILHPICKWGDITEKSRKRIIIIERIMQLIFVIAGLIALNADF